jgi:hypothetical protein
MLVHSSNVNTITVAGLLLSTTAFAGFKIKYPVVITSSYFLGSFGSARNSTNDVVHYLYCRDRGAVAYCGARDSNHKNVQCATTDPTHLNVIRGMDDSSRILVWYNSGRCTLIDSLNTSAAEPKVQ